MGDRIFVTTNAGSDGIGSDSVGYDVVGAYQQDEINGFTATLIDRMLDLVDPASKETVLDAMGGDGNLSLRLHAYCRRRNIRFPNIVMLEYSRVQYEFAKAKMSGIPADVIWGDVLEMKSCDGQRRLEDCAFDCVMIKSGNHEIPLDKQMGLYESVFRVLKPGGIFVNLGMLYDDPEERDELLAITRVKDKIIGMHSAVVNRYFLTRNELYDRLRRAGFADVRAGERFEYTIHSAIAQKHYFSKPGLEYAGAELQAAQARAMTMRRKNRLRFECEHSIMHCPGEITIARRPTWEEENAVTFRRFPYEFLRRLECHARLLDEVVRYCARQGAGESGDLLDLGAGPGLLAERFISRKGTYHGIDVSREYIDACNARLGRRPGFRFDVGDVNTTEFGAERYDAVTIINTLNLPGIKPVDVLRKAYNALRPGGRLIVSGPTSSKSYALAEPMMRAQLEREGLLKTYGEEFKAVGEANARLMVERGNYWSVEGMVALLRQLGFRTVVANTQIYYGFGYLVVVEK